ncbi:MAG: hypothetical protein JXA03_13920 [Bacteroidales bacterium]|nr:hypothetical protein [Bacteroidales bacterium]
MEYNAQIIKKFIAPLLGLVIFSSCLELTEEIKVNEDLSGTITFSLKPSEQESGLLGFAGLLGGFEMPATGEIEQYASVLRIQPGINDVRYNIDRNNTSMAFSIDFGDYRSLSKALAAAFNAKSIITINYLKIKKNKIRRRNFAPALARYLKTDEGQQIPMEALEWTDYRLTVTTPAEIKRARCRNCSVSSDRKVLEQRGNLGKVAKNKVSTAFRIRY